MRAVAHKLGRLLYPLHSARDEFPERERTTGAYSSNKRSDGMFLFLFSNRAEAERVSQRRLLHDLTTFGPSYKPTIAYGVPGRSADSMTTSFMLFQSSSNGI